MINYFDRPRAPFETLDPPTLYKGLHNAVYARLCVYSAIDADFIKRRGKPPRRDIIADVIENLLLAIRKSAHML